MALLPIVTPRKEWSIRLYIKQEIRWPGQITEPGMWRFYHWDMQDYTTRQIGVVADIIGITKEALCMYTPPVHGEPDPYEGKKIMTEKDEEPEWRWAGPRLANWFD
ncbi:hypothetical protein TRAPUB_5021 [Trametes pubescens]|uniref:Uncharacterized protein n=1 Tax=Trametes pubescens TaxID=154538 RepID=A0A1M2V9S1_TRAPU|nr:hypothetical protein TRAPUB_5021 [Trametes pubescens]